MYRLRLIFAVMALLLVGGTVIGPASATIALSDSTVTSQTPGANTTALAPGTVVDCSAVIMVIPSGATTFSQGHTLQLMTGLLAAHWNVQVLVDSVPAATIPQNGNVVFINGYLLSYPTGKDVSVQATVTGTVPQAETAIVITLIQATELDNSGNPVPGSVVTVERQIVPPVATPGQQAPVPAGTTQAPTKSPGFYLFSAVIALCLGVGLAGFSLKKSRT